ncbi:MAG TPA: carbohydrate kinase family protein [Bryobacteraceae bacterium]|nr:carbohydrate kinase family protein [Bryobacteraceae bacterium]
MNIPDVVVAGEIFVDWLMVGMDAWPEPGREVYAQEFHREIGGGTAITACALARLGLRCRLIAAVGTETSAWVAERLKSCGVTPELEVHPAEPTGVTVIASRPEDRAFLTYLGANKAFVEALGRRIASGKSLARHVHLSFPPPLDTKPSLIEQIRNLGSPVSLDVGWQRNWLSDRRAFNLLRSVDIFFPNYHEGVQMTGEQDAHAILKKFAAEGIRRVALKLGSEGAALQWDNRTYFAKPKRVRPVDTTGAGDCFNAGFLYAWLQGANPETCLEWGNICGALSTERYGGIEGCPDRDRLITELEKTPG